MQGLQYTGFIIQGAKETKLKKIPVLILDKPGVNKKVYPEDVVRDAIQRYKQLCEKDPTRRYIFAKHPKDEDEEWLGLIAGVCNDLYIENKVLYADVTLLPTTWGYAINWLLQHNYTIGTSIRGRIKARDDYFDVNGKKILVKVATFMEFEGFDFVVFPSYIVTQATSEHIKEQRRYLPGEISSDVDVLCSLYGVCSCEKELK